MGSVTWRVAEGGMASDSRVEEMFVVVVRCLPAWTRRRSVGATEVRRARSWRRVLIVVFAGTSRGMAVKRFLSLKKILNKEDGLTLA